MRGEPYMRADLDFVTSLANLAAISLENARLFREAIEKQRLEDDLLIAREIQRGLLPLTLPDIPQFGLSAANISSKQVGGDYYDVVALGGSRFMLAIGDVAGKGTPASLLMANLQATIRALVSPDASLGELTGRVNDLLCDNTTSGRFITFFWGILDPGSRTLRYVSAGHNPPYLLHANGKIERLEAGGLILGVLKTAIPYEEGEARFGPGDILLMFTDGVSEAMNKAGEEFGEDRLEKCLRGAAHSPAAEIITRIVDDVKRHSAGAPQSDDITLLALKAD
jgi:sigma-B regulation protein RsbU (phosphoserine phosphatase)